MSFHLQTKIPQTRAVASETAPLRCHIASCSSAVSVADRMSVALELLAAMARLDGPSASPYIPSHLRTLVNWTPSSIPIRRLNWRQSPAIYSQPCDLKPARRTLLQTKLLLRLARTLLIIVAQHAFRSFQANAKLRGAGLESLTVDSYSRMLLLYEPSAVPWEPS